MKKGLSIMKKGLIIGIISVLFIFSNVNAEVVTAPNVTEGDTISFAWDANTESDLAGYKIFRSDDETVFGQEVYDVACQGGNTSTLCTTWQTDQTPVGTWFWRITAYDLVGNESAPASNILSLTVDAYNPPPAPPVNWRFDVTP